MNFQKGSVHKLVRALPSNHRGSRNSRLLLSGSRHLAVVIAGFMALAIAGTAYAHGVAEGDEAYIRAISGVRIGLFFYLGAKHMVTGIDHLLFLTGVIFLLYRFKDVALYVTLFAAGHSITLIAGVLSGIQVNSNLVDAVIGLSVVYKAMDNIGLFKRWFGLEIDARYAVFGFGLVHGLGLATKVQALNLSRDGLLANLISFNVGVEFGQILALSAILIAFTYWRKSRTFVRWTVASNFLLIIAGLALFGAHMVDFATQGAEI